MNSADQTLIVIGASYAGVQLAVSAREQGFGGRILLIGDEPHMPYQRPPLSKAFLLGGEDTRSPQLRSEAFFAEEKIELLLSTRVAKLDRDSCHVVLENGDRLAYDFAALATGAKCRKLACPGADLDGIHYLRDLGDATRLRAAAKKARRVVIIGGGFIGLEVAASLRSASVSGISDVQVTLVETEARLLSRVSPPLISDFVLGVHVAHGVRCMLGRRVTSVRGEGSSIQAVELDDGSSVDCDMLIVGIGVVPNVDIAAESGLAIGNGIVVDLHGRSNDKRIFAAGDCAAYPNPWAYPQGSAVRLESVQSANDLARAAGAAIAGKAEPYYSVPWFWSDQYDLKFQMAGLAAQWDDFIVRGALEQRSFSVFYFRKGVLIAVDSVNRPQDHMLARKFLAAGISPAIEQVRDEQSDLKKLLA